MSHNQNYPPRVHYMLHVPILAFNICVITTMAWVATQTSGFSFLGPLVSSVSTGGATLWVLIGLLLTLISHQIPLLARILVDSLLAIPCYIGSIVVIAANEDWLRLTKPLRENQCYLLTLEQCQHLRRLTLGLEILAMVLGIFSVGLTVADCGYAIHLRRTERRAESDTPCYEPDYPAKLNYIIHGIMLGLNTLVIIMMSWALTQGPTNRNTTNYFGPMTALICTGWATIWIITVLVSAKYGENIRSLARILVDSLFIIPCYTASVVMIGLFGSWDGIVSPPCGPSDGQSCADVWRAVIALEILAIIFGATCFALTIFDCGYSIRLHRRMLGLRKEGRRAE